MLTEVEEGMASGIRNIEWDAVELPSQFMVGGKGLWVVKLLQHT
jgi:Zn-dependent oligopeptidase